MSIQKGIPQATPDPEWPVFDTAPCGCPRYDTGNGILKIHGKDCSFAVKPKPKAAPKTEAKPAEKQKAKK